MVVLYHCAMYDVLFMQEKGYCFQIIKIWPPWGMNKLCTLHLGA